MRFFKRSEDRMSLWQRIFGGQKKTVEPPQSFFQYLSINAKQLGIEARGDRVGDKVTYQWANHGPFTVEKGVSDDTTTIVSLGTDLLDDFVITMLSKYKDYLAPFRRQGATLPKVVVNKQLQNLEA